MVFLLVYIASPAFSILNNTRYIETIMKRNEEMKKYNYKKKC